MYRRPRFSLTYQVRIDDEGVLLVRDDDYVVLGGTVCRRLAPFLDGEHTVDEIVTLLGGEVGAAEIYFTLMQLEDRGYLSDGDGTAPLAHAVLWARLGVDLDAAAERLLARSVRLYALGGKDLKGLEALLKEMHVRVEEEGGLAVVLTADYLDPGLAAFNRAAVAEGTALLLARVSGSTVWVGPLIEPGRTACWACLAHRLRANRPAHVYLGQEHVDDGVVPSVMRLAEGMIATEVLRWMIAPDDHPLSDRIVRYDAAALDHEVHRVGRRPQCPACGEPGMMSRPRPIELQSRPLVHALDGGFRTTTPEQTLALYEHLVSPLAGVVRTLRPVPVDGTDLVHNYTVGHAMHRAGVTLGSLRHNTRDHSGGKGRTDAQARASGLCEALERHSALYQGDEPVRLARWADLGEEAVRPEACLLFSETQYRERAVWNEALNGTFQFVPEPFDEHEEIAWTPVWSLTENRFRDLPTAYCYFGYDGPGCRYCRADSNGLAAGNCVEEAILQGFLELVERDAVALWWYNRTAQPGVDLDGFGDPYVDALRTYYQTLGRELWVLDITSDFGWPVFVAVSRSVRGPSEDLIMGFGAHFSAHIALQRALSELNQTLPTILRSPEARARQLLPDFKDALDWWASATLESEPYLAPSPDLPARKADAYASVVPVDLRAEVGRCVERAADLGLDVLALDMTRPDVGLSVVKVFVPGMRHFWRRLGAGRLYDVPVALGWLDRPNPENGLNPTSLFL